jgi:hypothetical protein
LCNYSGYQVHGSRFRVSYFALLIFFELVDESTNGSTCFSGLFVNIFEFVGRNVLFIQGDLEFALDFRARPLGISQEPDELRIRLGIETFGNIMHR